MLCEKRVPLLAPNNSLKFLGKQGSQNCFVFFVPQDLLPCSLFSSIMEEDNRASEFMIKNLKLAGGLRGWDRGTKRLWPTLTRQTLDEAWGFSLISGCDIGEGTAHWSGIVAHRHDKGRWLKVSSFIPRHERNEERWPTCSVSLLACSQLKRMVPITPCSSFFLLFSGKWFQINSVKSHGPADLAGIQKNDFVTRINGQIVFHLSLKDVERIIRNSGCSLLLDIER